MRKAWPIRPTGGLGNYPTARMPPERHAAADGAGRPRYPPHLSRTGATGPRTPSPPTRATRSANGSTRTATAATTCSSRDPRPPSRAPAPTTPPGCRCTSTMSRPSRAVPPRQERPEHPSRRDHGVRPRPDAAVERPTRPSGATPTASNWTSRPAPEGNTRSVIGTENYFLCGGRMPMPAKKTRGARRIAVFQAGRGNDRARALGARYATESAGPPDPSGSISSDKMRSIRRQCAASSFARSVGKALIKSCLPNS